MKLRQARKIMKRFYANGNSIHVPYGMPTLDKAIRRTHKIRLEECRVYNEEHYGDGTFMTPQVIVNQPDQWLRLSPEDEIRRELEKEIKQRYSKQIGLYTIK